LISIVLPLSCYIFPLLCPKYFTSNFLTQGCLYLAKSRPFPFLLFIITFYYYGRAQVKTSLPVMGMLEAHRGEVLYLYSLLLVYLLLFFSFSIFVHLDGRRELFRTSIVICSGKAVTLYHVVSADNISMIIIRSQFRCFQNDTSILFFFLLFLSYNYIYRI
jgi:hypothetical protein